MGREKEESGIVLKVFAILGFLVAVCAIAYVIYRFFAPAYYEGYDDFDDVFEDEYSEEETLPDEEA